MNQCLKSKKQQKVEIISAQVLSNFQGIEKNRDSPISIDEFEEVEQKMVKNGVMEK